MKQHEDSAELRSEAQLEMKVDADGVEDTGEDDDGEIKTPYDPTKTHIITKQQSLDTIIKRIEFNEIDIAPEFQRHPELWSATKMSRLIESLLIRIPLPAFYFDGSDDEKWLIVDGMQRLTTFKRFLVDEDDPLRLTNLEYLTQYEDYTADALPRDLVRRIAETQVTLHIIQAGTPPKVKYNIFRRINTGGMILKPQEIRHALHQGPATELLARLAQSREFISATAGSVGSKRMLDREMVLRFLSFTLTHYTEYKDDNLDAFLTSHMERLNQCTEAHRQQLSARFMKAMVAARKIFDDKAFRKPSLPEQRRFPVNKPLFEAWSALLGALSDQQIAVLTERRRQLYSKFTEYATKPALLSIAGFFERSASQQTTLPQ